MLIEFRVKNFRSMRDEQVLSLIAAKDKTLQDTNTIASGVTETLTLLRSAVIYGPNAGGKSNLIKALQYMRGVVVESASSLQPGQSFSIQPFRLDDVSSAQPTEFEVTFILDNVRYQYGFTINAERVVSEHLLVYKSFKPQRWFERYYDSDSVKALFRQLKSLSDFQYVLTGADRCEPLTENALPRAIKRIQERVGIPEWTAHDLRRTFATQLGETLQIDPVVIEKCLGHKMPRIMATYNKNEMLPQRQDALNLWAQCIENLLHDNTRPFQHYIKEMV